MGDDYSFWPPFGSIELNTLGYTTTAPGLYAVNWSIDDLRKTMDKLNAKMAEKPVAPTHKASLDWWSLAGLMATAVICAMGMLV